MCARKREANRGRRRERDDEEIVSQPGHEPSLLSLFIRVRLLLDLINNSRATSRRKTRGEETNMCFAGVRSEINNRLAVTGKVETAPACSRISELKRKVAENDGSSCWIDFDRYNGGFALSYIFQIDSATESTWICQRDCYCTCCSISILEYLAGNKTGRVPWYDWKKIISREFE